MMSRPKRHHARPMVAPNRAIETDETAAGATLALAAAQVSVMHSVHNISNTSRDRGGTQRSMAKTNSDRLRRAMAQASRRRKYSLMIDRWPCSHRVRCVRLASSAVGNELVT